MKCKTIIMSIIVAGGLALLALPVSAADSPDTENALQAKDEKTPEVKSPSLDNPSCCPGASSACEKPDCSHEAGGCLLVLGGIALLVMVRMSRKKSASSEDTESDSAVE